MSKKRASLSGTEKRIGESLDVYLNREYTQNHRSAMELETELGVSRSTISRWLDKYDIRRRGVSEARLPKGFIIPLKEELEQVYSIKKESIESIAKVYSVSPATIKLWLDDNGIERRSLSEACLPKGSIKPSKEKLEQMYIKDARTPTDIAKEIGISRPTVHIWLNKYNIPRRGNSEARLPKGVVLPSKEKLEQLYMKDKKSTVKIAEEFSVSSSTIYILMDKYDIKRRTSSGALLLRKGIVKPSKEKLEQMYNRDGMLLREIEREIGVGHTTLTKWIKEFGLQKWATRKKDGSEKDQIESLLEKYANGEK